MEILIGVAVIAVIGGVLTFKQKKKRKPANPHAPVEYTSFQGDKYTLHPVSQGVIRLLVPVVTDECRFIAKYCEKAYQHYARVCGFPYDQITIAIVDEGKTCGAGCGYLGQPGIEIMRSYWERILSEAKQGNVVHIPLYELGRNYWTLFDKCNFGGLATGFAIYHELSVAKGMRMADFKGMPFAQFDKHLRGLVDKYLADESLNYSNTFAIDKGIPNDPLGLGGADLVASLLLKLDEKFNTGGLWSKAHRLEKGGDQARKFVGLYPPDAQRWLVETIGFPAP